MSQDYGRCRNGKGRLKHKWVGRGDPKWGRKEEVKVSSVKINVRESWRGNPEWIIQRNWQQGAHKTLNEEKTKTKQTKHNYRDSYRPEVVGALGNYSLVFVVFINFFRQLKDWVGQVLFLVSCPKGQVKKYVNVEACVKRLTVIF
jgi:hypothetical protein